MRAQRSFTSAAEVGRNIMDLDAWPKSCRPHELWNMLDASESTVEDLVNKVIRKLPASMQECAELEGDCRASSRNSSKIKQKRRLDTLSAASDTLAEEDVQLAWGYVLRQLQQVGAHYVQWYLHDTSHSGITGHSGKVDYCMTADTLKAWPQVVALAELKKELTSSLYTECIGQLSARSVNLFDEQPHRKHAVMSSSNPWRCWSSTRTFA